MDISKQQIVVFQETLQDYYAKHGRHSLPWRQAETDGLYDPYKIMVSELMLQQTQVPRVIPKYTEFLALFPSAKILATSEQGDVLRAWQGLGYNRRAKFLWQAAQAVAAEGTFPSTLEGLTKLPGIGKNTAGAILAYAYNQPSVFIETNVRTVYIHSFLDDQPEVSDQQITHLLEQTIDTENPREFYWSLMDYGTHIKATVGNLNRVSKHYTKQSAFNGSKRQIRGQVIRMLGEGNKSLQDLQTHITDNRLAAVLNDLQAEGLVRQNGSFYSL